MIAQTKPTKTPSRTTAQNITATLNEVAFEIERLERDIRALWYQLPIGKKISLLCAVGIVIGEFLPWLSMPRIATEIGLSSGGTIHLLLCFFSFCDAERKDLQAIDPLR